VRNLPKKNNVIEKIKDLSGDIYKDINKKKNPEMKIPVRALSNVKYDSKDGFFELKGDMKTRTLTASTVKTFAQTLKMMSLSKELIKTEDIATK
jgi:DNA topoisomerase-6 subunit A